MPSCCIRCASQWCWLDPCGEREIRTEAHEYRAPIAIVDIEVVLHDPALGQLQVPAVIFLVADGDQYSSWFACFENYDHLIGLCSVKMARHELIAATFGSFQDWS